MTFDSHTIVLIVIVVIAFALVDVLLDVSAAHRAKRREQEKPAEDGRQDVMK